MPHENIELSPLPFWASLVDDIALKDTFSVYADPHKFTRFEQLVISSVKEATKNCDVDLGSERTLFILSTTKGNVDLLSANAAGHFGHDRAYLWHTAQLLQHFFNLKHTPVVVSNACISGVLSIIAGARMIRSGRFDHVIVAGADIVTEFVLSGFGSFQSLCTGPCKPFDKDRQGLSLGEGAGTLVMTAEKEMAGGNFDIRVGTGFSSNDANHISGPSRTGEGLYIAIRRTLKDFDHGIGFISAHGTATVYNDEMESIAISRAGLEQVPVNSFKGYWGHTLGAAGVIESVASIASLRGNVLFNTLGFSSLGVSRPVTVINKTINTPVQSCLKIASGFGGCNASVLFFK